MRVVPVENGGIVRQHGGHAQALGRTFILLTKQQRQVKIHFLSLGFALDWNNRQIHLIAGKYFASSHLYQNFYR